MTTRVYPWTKLAIIIRDRWVWELYFLFVVTLRIEMQGDRYFVRIRTSSIRTGQNRSSADTGVMSSPCPSQGFSKQLCPWPWQTNSGRYYDVPRVVLYGSYKIITSLCSVLAPPFSFDCGLDGEYDLERERDRLRDILCNKMKTMNYDFLYVYFTLWTITYGSWITMNFRVTSGQSHQTRK